VLLAEHDNVIHTLATDRSDQWFGKAILPAMPAHERFGPDDRHGLEDRRKPTTQLDEEQAIAVREPDAIMHLALQHNQLMPERGILCFKSTVRLEQRKPTASKGSKAVRPSRSTLSDSITRSIRTTFRYTQVLPRMASASAQQEIDEPTGKFLRPRGDIANMHFEQLA